MIKSEFDALAHEMGAILVYKTSPVAVFKSGPYTVSVEIDPGDLHQVTPLILADLMAGIKRHV